MTMFLCAFGIIFLSSYKQVTSTSPTLYPSLSTLSPSLTPTPITHFHANINQAINNFIPGPIENCSDAINYPVLKETISHIIFNLSYGELINSDITLSITSSSYNSYQLSFAYNLQLPMFFDPCTHLHILQNKLFDSMLTQEFTASLQENSLKGKSSCLSNAVSVLQPSIVSSDTTLCNSGNNSTISAVQEIPNVDTFTIYDNNIFMKTLIDFIPIVSLDRLSIQLFTFNRSQISSSPSVITSLNAVSTLTIRYQIQFDGNCTVYEQFVTSLSLPIVSGLFRTKLRYNAALYNSSGFLYANISSTSLGYFQVTNTSCANRINAIQNISTNASTDTSYCISPETNSIITQSISAIFRNNYGYTADIRIVSTTPNWDSNAVYTSIRIDYDILVPSVISGNCTLYHFLVDNLVASIQLGVLTTLLRSTASNMSNATCMSTAVAHNSPVVSLPSTSQCQAKTMTFVYVTQEFDNVDDNKCSSLASWVVKSALFQSAPSITFENLYGIGQSQNAVQVGIGTNVSLQKVAIQYSVAVDYYKAPCSNYRNIMIQLYDAVTNGLLTSNVHYFGALYNEPCLTQAISTPQIYSDFGLCETLSLPTLQPSFEPSVTPTFEPTISPDPSIVCQHLNLINFLGVNISDCNTQASICGTNVFFQCNSNDHIIFIGNPPLRKLRAFHDTSSNSPLSGTLPTELALLRHLVHLQLGTSSLIGTVPTEFGLLTSLVEITLSNNSLTGRFPSEIGLLNLLARLDISFNYFATGIPSEVSLLIQKNRVSFSNSKYNQLNADPLIVCQTTNLIDFFRMGENCGSNICGVSVNIVCNENNEIIDIITSESLLFGTMSSELHFLTSLQNILLAGNFLSGPLPSEIGLLNKLVSLDISNNYFATGIPSEVSLLKSENRTFQFSNFKYNQLNADPLVVCQTLALVNFFGVNNACVNDTNICGASVNIVCNGNNEITGIARTQSLPPTTMMPSELALLVSLQYLDLSALGLVGTVPSEVGMLSSLNSFDIHNNQMSGTVPPEISSLSSLHVLDISYNYFTTGIPRSIVSLPFLTNFSFINYNRTTPAPSVIPSFVPTIEPSVKPSLPTKEPTNEPTIVPTNQPILPTYNPSKRPNVEPTKIPTHQPTIVYTKPSRVPTFRPSLVPIISPTYIPSYAGERTVVFQNGLNLPNNSTRYNSSFDITISTLYSNFSYSNFNGYTFFWGPSSFSVSEGFSGSPESFRVLLKFTNIEKTIRNATVTYASLSLLLTNWGSTSQFSTCFVTKPWDTRSYVRYQGTGWKFNAWNSETSSSTSWDQLGGDCLQVGNTTTTVPGGNGDVRVTIPIDPSIVANWLSNPSSNYGILMKSSSSSFVTLATTNATIVNSRPKLTISYVTTSSLSSSIVPTFSPTSNLKTIVFLPSPTSVYTNVSYYIKQRSPPASYLFTFQLSDLPSLYIIIQTSILFKGVATNVIQTYPSVFSFLSNSAQKQASFYINGPVSNYGDYTIQLTISAGASVSEYSNVLIEYPVILLSPPSPSRVPKITSARFNDGGNGFTILFDSSSPSPTIISSVNWNCSNLFKFTQSSITTCTWVNDSAVVATLPQNSNVLPGISVLYMYNNSVASSVTLLPAYRPITPKAVIYTSSKVSSCDDIVLDASSSSGSGSRPFFSIVWTALEDGSNESPGSITLTNFLNEFNSLHQPITIPKTYINGNIYIFSLTLTNFMQQVGQVSVTVTISPNTSDPSVTIIGSLDVEITTGNSLLIVSSAKMPSCAPQASVLSYIWTIQNTKNLTNTAIKSKKSTSKNPTQYFLDAYTLRADQSYIVTLTVQAKSATTNRLLGETTTMISVTVVRSILAAIIKGGTDFHPPVDKPFLLDATLSRDYDLPPSSTTSNLRFAWTCFMMNPDPNSISNSCGFSNVYDTSENVQIVARSSASIINITANKLSLVSSYVFTCFVFSNDGRQSSTAITVNASPAGSVEVTITTAPDYATETDSFSIIGSLNYNRDLVAVWSAYLSGTPYNFSAATPLIRQIPGSSANQVFAYPIFLQPGSLPAGRTYQFRLTSYPVGLPDLKSFAEISIKIIGSPQSGYVASEPNQGYALQTRFKLSSSGWVDDPDSMPLTYAFSYSLLSSRPDVVVGLPSYVSYVISKLAAGLSENNNVIVIKGTVYNVFGASAKATTTIIVRVNASVSINGYLSDALASAVSSGDSSVVLQAVGNAANMYNLGQYCPPVVNCTNINRNPCSSTLYTCGSCLNGYSGISGDSNVPCYKFSFTQPIGGTCSIDSDCNLRRCENKICKPPLKSCKRSNLNQLCSGKGTCGFFNSSTNAKLNSSKECTEYDDFCYAQCTCDAGYVGVDCSLTLAELNARAESRSSLCRAIAYVGATQNPASTLVNTLSNTLNQAYNPSEVVTPTSYQNCLNCLVNISALAQAGYLTSSTSTNSYFAVVSNFLLSQSGLSPKSATQRLSSSIHFTDDGTSASSLSRDVNTAQAIDNAITYFQQGYFKTGVVSGSGPLQIYNDGLRITFYYDDTSTFSNQHLAPPNPTTSTDRPGTASQSSIILTQKAKEVCGWGQSFQLSIVSISRNPFGSKTVMSSPLRITSSLNNANIAFTTTSFPVYYIVLQYQQQQSFNLTAISFGKLKNSVNYTIPKCTTYDYTTGEYVECQYCNISSVSNYNVTYACYSNSICATTSSSVNPNKQNHQTVINKISLEDTVSTSTTDPTAIFNNILTEIGTEIQQIVTVNPSNINLGAALPVLILSGCLLFVLIFGLIYFRIKDVFESKKLINDLVMSNSTKALCQPPKSEVVPQSPLKSLRQSRTNFRQGSDLSHLSSDSESKSEFSQESELSDVHRDALRNSRTHNTKVNQELKLAVAVDKFMNRVLPLHIFDEVNKWKRFLTAMYNKHRYIRVFASPSLTDSRVSRFLAVYRIILIAVFVDTLLFQISYPDTSQCESYITQTNCLAKQSPIQSVCQWDTDINTCNPNDPPSSVFFYFLVSLICLMILVPLDVFFDEIDKEICSKRPDLTKLGLTPDNWLVRRNTELVYARDNDISSFFDVSPSTSFRTVEDTQAVIQSLTSDPSSQLYPKKSSNLRAASSQNTNSFYNVNGNNSWMNTISFRIRNTHVIGYRDHTKSSDISSGNSDIISDSDPRRFVSISAETEYLLGAVQEYFKQISESSLLVDETDTTTTMSPLVGGINDVAVNSSSKQKRISKLQAIMQDLKLNPDGTFLPLNCYETIIHYDNKNRIMNKLYKAKKAAEKTKKQCIEVSETNNYLRDITLIHRFINENLSSLKRFILKKYIYQDSMNVEKIDPFYWFLGWVVYLGSMLFFIYWTFAWGLSNGGSSLKAWSYCFWITLVQDLTAAEIMKIYVYYVVGVSTLRKQITDVHRVLKTVLSRLIHYGPIYDVSYVRVCQHTLGTCRASYFPELRDLPSAKLLRELDDDDIAIIKQTKNKKVATPYAILLGIPAIISHVSEFFSELFKEWTPPLLVGGFLLLNATLMSISVWAIVVPYCVLFLICFHLYFIYYPAKKRLETSTITGRPYINPNLQFLDNTIVFFSFTGMKKFFCECEKTEESAERGRRTSSKTLITSDYIQLTPRTREHLSKISPIV